MTMTKANAPAQTDRGLSGHTVLIMLVAFFGVVFAVNGYFAFAAIDTYTGVVAQEPYRKGLTYNRRIAAGERQAELHWTAAVDAARDGHTSIDLVGADGRPVTDLKVAGTLGRPSTDSADQTLTFTETKPGRYETQGAALDAGTWIVSIAARYDVAAGDPVFQLRKRLWLKP
jgi:nitrogen fixation protein FixH